MLPKDNEWERKSNQNETLKPGKDLCISNQRVYNHKILQNICCYVR